MIDKKYKEDVDKYIEEHPDCISPQDKLVLSRESGWAIEPLIFVTESNVRSPLLSVTGVEMTGDSNLEAINNGTFTNIDIDRDDYIYMMEKLEHQQIIVITKNITNYIKESSIISFSNYCRTAFDQILHIDTVFPEASFRTNINEDKWISGQVSDFISQFIWYNKKYNLMKAFSKTKGTNMIPDSIWRDYVGQIAVNVSQYIGSMMIRSLSDAIYFAAYCDTDTTVKNMIEYSVLVKSNMEEQIFRPDYFVYTYISNFVSNSLYKLVVDCINPIVFNALCNVPNTFVTMFSDNIKLSKDQINKD